jgi:hypothetical protein
MTKDIYIVMSEELLDHEEWEKSPCRAFDNKTEAEQFKKVLQELHRENKHYEPVTRFYVQSIPFGKVTT